MCGGGMMVGGCPFFAGALGEHTPIPKHKLWERQLFFLMLRSHSISLTGVQGSPLCKIGFAGLVAFLPADGLCSRYTYFSPCVQAGSDAEGPGALLAAAVQCRAAKALRTLLTLPSNCTAFVGMGACMQRLPKLLLSGTSGSQQLSSVLVRALPVGLGHMPRTFAIRYGAALSCVVCALYFASVHHRKTVQ
jgi:hypothetical protein